MSNHVTNLVKITSISLYAYKHKVYTSIRFYIYLNSSWLFSFDLFNCIFLSCLCTEDFLVHYIFIFTLRTDDCQAVRELILEQATYWRSSHTSDPHIQTLPCALLMVMVQQTFTRNCCHLNLKWLCDRIKGMWAMKSFSIINTCEYCGFNHVFVQSLHLQSGLTA